jgi:hypothetical protein
MHHAKRPDGFAPACNVMRPYDVIASSPEKVDCPACLRASGSKVELAPAPERKHSHYFKSVAGLEVVDIYRVLLLFNVTDPCLQHAAKKILVAGGRGKGDVTRDVQEAIDSLERWKTMRAEEKTT